MEREQELLSQANQLCQEEQFEKALSIFDEILSSDADFSKARYSRAKAFFKLQRFEECLADFEILIAAHPLDAHILSERAVAFLLAGQGEMALTDLNKAAELEPSNPYRFASRAFVKDKLGDYYGAIADYEIAIELDPEDAISYNNKGLVEEKLGWKEKSEQSFAKADKKDPAKKTQPDSKPEFVAKNEREKVPRPKQEIAKPKTADYISVMWETVSTKKGWKELGDFWRQKLGNKY